MIINIGQFNKMKVVREADFGYYLDRELEILLMIY